MIRQTAMAAALAFLASTASAREPLNTEAQINDSLRAGLIANIIRKGCPTIDARIPTALLKVQQLKAYARGLGYSSAEINAFIDSPSEKRRMKAEAADWLAGQGASQDDAESLCAVGWQEIAAGSLIGQLLRER